MCRTVLREDNGCLNDISDLIDIDNSDDFDTVEEIDFNTVRQRIDHLLTTYDHVIINGVDEDVINHMRKIFGEEAYTYTRGQNDNLELIHKISPSGGLSEKWNHDYFSIVYKHSFNILSTIPENVTSISFHSVKGWRLRDLLETPFSVASHIEEIDFGHSTVIDTGVVESEDHELVEKILTLFPKLSTIFYCGYECDFGDVFRAHGVLSVPIF